MNTARLKNIVILILLLANAFLLVLLFSRRAEENAAHERSVTQLTALLNADGIAFDSALLDGLPDTVLSVQPARDLAAEQALAEGIIGSVTSIDSRRRHLPLLQLRRTQQRLLPHPLRRRAGGRRQPRGGRSRGILRRPLRPPRLPHL